MAALSGAVAVRAALAQDRAARGPKARLSPAVCLHSEQLRQVGYDELGGVLQTLGFDGCVISVEPGGHVTPEHADLDLMRAIEAITGVGLDVPAIATSFTAPMTGAVRLAFAVGREMGVPLFRPGTWKYGVAVNPDARLLEIQRDLLGLASLAGQTGMSVALHNGAGDAFGASLWDIQNAIRGLDARLAGYDFDIGYATAAGGVEGAATALRLTLPRLKMVTARDCYWAKEGGVWQLRQCPLGQGMVAWPAFFGALAKARFTGPVLLFIEYKPEDDLAALRADLAFLRKQLAAAYVAG
jgi:sugar phosphate isomerase/epimerase